MILVGEDLSTTLDTLSDLEIHYGEGDKGEVRIYVDKELSQAELQSLEDMILSQGVVLTGRVTQDLKMVLIPFQKAMSPLLVIALSANAVIGAIIGWQVFKANVSSISALTWILGGLAFVYLATNKSVRKILI